jgi:hypothetical protein
MLAFVFLPTILGTSHCLVFVPLINCPSARCASAANAVGKDLDIFAVGAVSLNHIIIIFVHTPNVLYYVVLIYHILCYHTSSSFV